ncbi:acetyl-CoA carboxylase biotin carboxyl carrier protein [Kibdelosporangium banguiense]|uniref:Biotin carboxyl carrier protein of acetyl-CoA carboxylase n=1 Tax=Kibdelosporangium banguiense TaxID=1365924 RepID=A0ABS4TTF6_9PSEU|nr:biotin/lipoyl-containing protein [Kibdelosporangium banguiense]MBP2327260.1 acetyl-CoA carboxylase biotin carboxyl carrier protein [Kibdelosporangium banguiense]
MTEDQRVRGAAEMGLWEADIARLPAQEAMDLLCQGLTAAVRVVPGVPSRASVRFGQASIEVEWPAVPAAPHAAEATSTDTAERHALCAALVGTFYRALEPGAKPFVQVGDLVEAGQQVAIIEAMKLMNPVTADVRGRVVEFLANDAEPVEYGQPLLVLEPEEAQ